MVDCEFTIFVGLKAIANEESVPDGKICINDEGELAVTKFAVEPVCSRS